MRIKLFGIHYARGWRPNQWTTVQMDVRQSFKKKKNQSSTYIESKLENLTTHDWYLAVTIKLPFD
jgi:hypothetical protein